MRVFASLHVLCTFDPDQVQEAFDQLVVFDDTDVVTASKTQAGLVVLAPSTTSQQFSFGSVASASTLLVVAYDAVRFQLNGNTAPFGDAIPVPASSSTAVMSTYQRAPQPGSVFVRGKTTSLYLTNPSSVAPARVFVAVVGDAL